MDKLSAFQFNNTRKLFELAKKLNHNKFFNTFLTEQQFKVLNHILELDSFDLWYNFLEGNCYLKFLDDTSENDAQVKLQSKEPTPSDESKDPQSISTDSPITIKQENSDELSTTDQSQNPKSSSVEPISSAPASKETTPIEEAMSEPSEEAKLPIDETKEETSDETSEELAEASSGELAGKSDEQSNEDLSSETKDSAQAGNTENPDEVEQAEQEEHQEQESSTPTEIIPTESELLFEEGFKMINMLALHIRYLLWEKAIVYYYNSRELDESIYTIEEVSDDYELIDSLDQPDEDERNAAAAAEKAEAPQTETREEDDDYDDDDDEEEDQGKLELASTDNKASEDADTFLSFNDENQALLEIPTSIFKTQPSDEESSASRSTTQTTNTKLDTNHEEDDSNSEVILEPKETRDPPSEPIDSAKSGLEDHERLIKEFNKVYHNFEYDRETLIKRRRLEMSDLQLENSKSGSSNFSNTRGPGGRQNLNSSSSATTSSDLGDANSSNGNLNINLGSASTTLQSLLNRISQKRDAVPLNDFELRSLFMDVRKNRGKWANDDRVGQEELYEACEKVVLELRGYTEHSTPFLNKVAKRDAPNYTLIIKKPMDLNTVMKKLKTLSYHSKQEFVDDLMLIWSNCLSYNADPKHFIRTHAHAMQKKTLKLAPTIPNITIRSRADIEREEEEELKQSTPVATNAKTTSTTTTTSTHSTASTTTTMGSVSNKLSGMNSGKSMKKGRKRSRQDVIKTETDPNSPTASGDVTSAPESKEVSETPGLENSNISADEDEDEDDDTENLNTEPSNDGVNAATDDEQEEDDDDVFDPELQAWRTLTAKSRANYCAQRAELFDENYHLRENASAIIRKSTEMKNFNQYLKNSEVIAKSSNILENDEPYLLEYDITGGVPGFEYKGLDEEQQEKKEQKLADLFLQQVDGDASKIKSDFVLPTDSGLNKIYFENINQMQEIRKICFKISLIRQMQTQQFVHHTQMKQPEIEAIREVDVDSASNLPNHDPFNHEVQFSVLRRNVAKIAMQTGFETADPFAINTLTQLAEKYLGNLIKSLKLHAESNTLNKLDNREMLLLSLLENGVNKPDDLYTYVKERIIKQRDKLISLRENLSNFLKELLRPGLENFNERSFDDNSEQFMTGDFSNDLGDDFFGFKQLGLDKEFKLLSTSIPIYLLHSRLHNSYATAGITSKRNKHEDLNEYVQQKLIASDIDDQIGLLKPFYSALYDKSRILFIKNQKKKGESAELPENNSLLLVEDEELPQKQRNIRPRLPPTGRITSIKKKIVANAFFIPEDEESETEVEANGDAPKSAADQIEFDDYDDDDLKSLEAQLKSEDEPLSSFSSPRKFQNVNRSPQKSQIKAEA